MYRFVIGLLPVVIGMVLLLPLQASAETVRSGLTKTLEGANIDNAGSIVQGLEGQLGAGLDSPIHDSVDFEVFPAAQLGLKKLSAPAALVLTPSIINYVFRGKPDSFQGSLRSYEFHLGKGIQKASHVVYPQVFHKIRPADSVAQVAAGEIAVLPELSEFRFRWGGAFTPVVYVSLKVKVTLFADGHQIFQKIYPVEDVKESSGSLFPNEDQEHRAISRALIEAFKQSAEDMAASPILLAYGQPKSAPQPMVAKEKIDMDAIFFLAGTWQQYAKNKGRLTLLEKQVATRFLRLQDAWEKKDTVRQQEQVSALIRHAKTLEPLSQKELLEELRYQKGYTDRQIAEENAAEDQFFNFAGNHTDTVLDYAGVGIELAKVGVLATGCIASSGTTCLMLSGTMAKWDLAGTVSEGIGAATEEYFHKSGDVTTAVFAGAQSSLIDFGAGKIAGSVAEATVGKLSHKVSRKMAKSAASASDTVAELATRVRDDVYVNSMKIFHRAPVSGAEVIFKDKAKQLQAYGEDLILNKIAEKKTLKSAPGTLKASTADHFNTLSQL